MLVLYSIGFHLQVTIVAFTIGSFNMNIYDGVQSQLCIIQAKMTPNFQVMGISIKNKEIVIGTLVNPFRWSCIMENDQLV